MLGCPQQGPVSCGPRELWLSAKAALLLLPAGPINPPLFPLCHTRLPTQRAQRLAPLQPRSAQSWQSLNSPPPTPSLHHHPETPSSTTTITATLHPQPPHFPPVATTINTIVVKVVVDWYSHPGLGPPPSSTPCCHSRLRLPPPSLASTPCLPSTSPQRAGPG